MEVANSKQQEAGLTATSTSSTRSHLLVRVGQAARSSGRTRIASFLHSSFLFSISEVGGTKVPRYCRRKRGRPGETSPSHVTHPLGRVKVSTSTSHCLPPSSLARTYLHSPKTHTLLVHVYRFLGNGNLPKSSHNTFVINLTDANFFSVVTLE